jgi:Spy/CpxP family protein refolding chaperone
METSHGSSIPNSTPDSTPAPNPERPAPGGDGRRHGRKFLGVLALVLVAGALGGFIGKSFAFGHGHGHGLMGMAADPAKMDEGVERMVKRFASRVDATPEQQQKLAVIAKGAARDIGPVHARLRDAHKAALAIAGAAQVDRAAIEKLRAEQLQLADTVSRRMTQALADAAEVLTPEQRRKIASRMAERMERREHRWGRG